MCIICCVCKVWCDGWKGICINCEWFGFGCFYDEYMGMEVV